MVSTRSDVSTKIARDVWQLEFGQRGPVNEIVHETADGLENHFGEIFLDIFIDPMRYGLSSLPRGACLFEGDIDGL